jgi:hypothetical protein
MVLGDHLGFAGLVVAVLGIGLTILWPTKRWIAYVCFGFAVILGSCWALAAWQLKRAENGAKSPSSATSQPSIPAQRQSAQSSSSMPTGNVTQHVRPKTAPSESHTKSPRYAASGVSMGDDSVGYGQVPAGTKIGNGSVYIGPTDKNGNTIIPPGTAVGNGASADPTGVAIGAHANARHSGNPEQEPKRQ